MKLLFIMATLLISLVAFSQSLPDFDFEAANGKKVNKSVLAKEKPVLIVYFDPYCDHCEWQAQTIKENAEKFRDINMIWVSWEQDEPNQEFFDKYLSGFKYAIVCKDFKFMIDTWFGYSEVPSIFCYNSKWEWVATFSKEQPAHVLLKALE